MPKLRYSRAIGMALTLACTLFFVQVLLAVDPDVLRSLPVEALAGLLPILVLAQVVLLVGVCRGFGHLVRATGDQGVTTRAAIVVWGKANLAKYLPGNVLHFAGRQLLGARLGWTQGGVATASLLETGLFVLLPSLLVVVTFLPLDPGGLLLEAVWLLPIVLVATTGILALSLGHRLHRRLPEALGRLTSWLLLPRPGELLLAAAYFVLFFSGMAVSAWLLYGVVVGELHLHMLPAIAGAFLLSWIMGLVIPGAPGGIGVREASFAVLGAPFLASEGLVAVAILMRLVTLGGEGLLFALALRLQRSLPAFARGVESERAAVRPRPAQLSAKRSTA